MNKWWAVLAVMALISMDFWNWEKSEPFIFFLPYWAWQIFFITISLSIIFAIFAKQGWGNKND